MATTVYEAINSMHESVEDRLMDEVVKFYRNFLGDQPVSDISQSSAIDTLGKYKQYKSEEYQAWQIAHAKAEERNRELELERERQKSERQGFFSKMMGGIGDTFAAMGRAMSLPSKPTTYPDKDILKDISLVQLYLGSVSEPGKKQLILPPTVGRALSNASSQLEGIQSSPALRYIQTEWDKRGVEEVAHLTDDQVYQTVVSALYSSPPDMEQSRELRGAVRTIMQVIRQYH